MIVADKVFDTFEKEAKLYRRERVVQERSLSNDDQIYFFCCDVWAPRFRFIKRTAKG